jgi:hypothetical protein
MVSVADNEGMILLFSLLGIVGICVLSAWFGVDSRFDDRGRNRPNL